MSPLRDRLLEALALKELPRAGWVRVGVRGPESVAAHSWGVAWLVLVLCPSELDRGKALALAVLHDLPEIRVGDLTPSDGVDPARKSRLESEAMAAMAAGLPSSEELVDLWEDYEHVRSPEARFVKACDKLDMALQAARYAGAQALDLGEFVDSALARLGPGLLRELAAEP